MTLHNSKVCCISDIHLGLHQNSQSWHKICLDFANWLKNKLLEQEIKDILILGDVFHHRSEISVNTLSVSQQFFKILEDFNIIILVGNHDAYYRDRSDVNSISIFDGWSNITTIDESYSDNFFGKTLSFWPWGCPIENIPESDILFGHFEIESFRKTKKQICATGLSSKSLLEKARLIISGHFHLREERNYTSGTILYLGNPFQHDWGDYDTSKGIYILDIKNLSYEFIENNMSPQHKKFTLSQFLKEKKIPNYVKEEFEGNFINFIIDKDCDLDKINNLTNMLSLYKPLSINTELDYDTNYNVADGDYNFTVVNISESIKEFIELLDIDNKEDILNHILELYRNVSK